MLPIELAEHSARNLITIIINNDNDQALTHDVNIPLDNHIEYGQEINLLEFALGNNAMTHVMFEVV